MLYETPRLEAVDHDVLGELEAMRADLRHRIAEPRKWTGLLRRSLMAASIQGSNSIEGYKVTLADAEAAVTGDEPLETDAATWQEITGYRDALTYVQQLGASPEFEWHHMLLNAMHFMLLKHRLSMGPGRFRPGGIYVTDTATQTVVYEGPDADRVPGLMVELAAWLNNGDPAAPAYVRAAMAHLNLVSIHPWRDGNGRMSRCVQTLVLAREGVLAPEFSSIEEWLGTGRNTYAYYDALTEVRGGARFEPHDETLSWVRFNLRAHHLQAQIVRLRFDEAARLWTELADLAEARHLPERAVTALYEVANGSNLRRASYQRDEGLSLDQAKIGRAHV